MWMQWGLICRGTQVGTAVKATGTFQWKFRGQDLASPGEEGQERVAIYHIQVSDPFGNIPTSHPCPSQEEGAIVLEEATDGGIYPWDRSSMRRL